jgi:GTP-binding protein
MDEARFEFLITTISNRELMSVLQTLRRTCAWGSAASSICRIRYSQAPRLFSSIVQPPSGVDKIRNIAVIAHVDHGKTTLVDSLLRLTNEGAFHGSMDCNELERERGITILSKCTRMTWKGHTLNVVDTPGHADFGGEVERVMSMVDGVLLVVDINEGPKPQTKFVLSKALALKHIKPIVVVNKVDRLSGSRSNSDIENEVFDLFATLDPTDEQMEYPTLYGSGKAAWAVKE